MLTDVGVKAPCKNRFLAHLLLLVVKLERQSVCFWQMHVVHVKSLYSLSH